MTSVDSTDIVYKQGKRAARREKTKSACNRQLAIHKAYGMEAKEAHRYHKQKALNCGSPKCFMCANPRKLHGNSEDAKTIAERSALQKNLFRNDEAA